MSATITQTRESILGIPISQLGPVLGGFTIRFEIFDGPNAGLVVDVPSESSVTFDPRLPAFAEKSEGIGDPSRLKYTTLAPGTDRIRVSVLGVNSIPDQIVIVNWIDGPIIAVRLVDDLDTGEINLRKALEEGIINSVPFMIRFEEAVRFVEHLLNDALPIVCPPLVAPLNNGLGNI